MKARHAAALALVSWFLMVPPGPNPATGYWRFLSQWKVIATFDSEAACKETQAAHQRLPQQAHVPSICIADDDLRLKGS
jgi:hypothetical protein